MREQEGLRRELRDTQVATQLQLTKLHRAVSPHPCTRSEPKTQSLKPCLGFRVSAVPVLFLSVLGAVCVHACMRAGGWVGVGVGAETERSRGWLCTLRTTQQCAYVPGCVWVQKRAAAQEPSERVAQLVERVGALEGARATLEGQVQQKEAIEAELRQQLTRLQRQAESHMVSAMKHHQHTPATFQSHHRHSLGTPQPLSGQIHVSSAPHWRHNPGVPVLFSSPAAPAPPAAAWATWV